MFLIYFTCTPLLLQILTTQTCTDQGEAANDTCAEKAVTGVEGDTNAETGVEGVTITGIDVEEGKIAENNNQPK